MSSTRLAVAALALAMGVGVAVACGPFFPWQLLDDRAETVSEPVALSFAFEVKRLVPAPSDNLTAVEPPDSYGADPVPEVLAAERKEASTGAWTTIVPEGGNASPEALLSKLEAARQAPDGKAAMVAGAGLPVAVLNYIAGAIEFRAGRPLDAAPYFEAINRLPERERRIREVAAAYMLGRVHQRTGAFEEARRDFEATRARARAGAPDPMGLAVASLGEEARVDLVDARLLPEVPWPIFASTINDAKTAELVGRAVRLYVEQAARGSKIALLSLREVALLLTADDAALALAVPDPLVRRLLVAYAVRRSDEMAWDESGPGAEESVVPKVINAVLAQPAPAAGDDLDRLAALAYQAGRYDVAERLVTATQWPLGLWVRAKLALRRNDRSAAVRDWAAALKATGGTGVAAKLDGRTETRLRGETAVITLSEGRYEDSLRLLFPAAGTYWGDVAYVAERILTVDELKALVDAGLPPLAKPPSDPGENDLVFAANPVESLRALLARRLVREGRTQEALAYFSKSVPADQPPDTPSAAADAQAYLNALEAARPTWFWRNVSRAEALFTVAMLSRKRGMELMGTEGPPDFAALDGQFSYGVGQSSPVPPPAERQGAEGVARAEKNRALLGPDEEKRFAASAPKPDIRFHYRMVASDQALAAADLLPERSQAYAAALCWASRFAIAADDQAKAEAIYRRYIATGAYQAWAKTFGRTCPEPDFEAARTFWPRRIASWSGQIVRSAERHAAILAAAVLVAALMAAGAVWLVRTRGAAKRG
jgi:hypothetical protein